MFCNLSLIRHRYHLLGKRWAAIAISSFFIFSCLEAKAQNEPQFDELTIFFQIQNIGAFEIPALIRDQEVLLPVTDIFDFLKIKTSYTPGMDSIAGFFLSPEATYQINRTTNKITFQGKTISLKPGDLIRTETNVYLLSKYFGEVFGLDCKFNFRTLSVVLTTKLELPIMREMRLEQMRQNVSKLKGDVKVDTTINRRRTPFHFGMADWSLISTQELGNRIDTRMNLALGTVIAGGEANAYLNFNTNEPFNEKQQYYFLRFVNNERSYLRQATFGKIATDAISSIYNPVIGMRLTNTPTTFRRSFGTYPLSDFTSPNWMVELYVNNVLVDYKKADSNGFFNFQVPLVYGNSAIKLKFYGPWGEERSKEQLISVPFSFMPPKEFEYTLNAGMVEDSLNSIYSRAAINYGVSRGITLGAGVEYLSTVVTSPIIPFISLATRPFSNMLLSGEYVYGVRSKGILSYQMPKNVQLELNYTKYKPGQKAVNFNYLEERKAILTLPIIGKNFSFYNRMTYNQIVLEGTGYSTAEWLISGSLLGISSNLTNYAMFVKNSSPYIYSNLSFSLRMPYGFQLNPQAQYEYSQHELISAKASIEKYLFKKGFFSLSYENNFKSKIQSLQVSLRYDLPFAQTGFTARQTDNQTTLMEMARGSLILDAKSKFLGVNNRVSVGKGGIVFAPFLDLNCNNKRDAGEPRAYGLNIRISGGNASQNDRDTTVRVMDLEPYTKYFVELDANSFDNVAWKIHNRTMSILIEPNSLKLVEIPVAVVGEVSGMVFKEKNGNQDGLGRVTINIFNLKSQLAGKTLSETDGYFSFLGLAPGNYEAKIDTAQLRKIHMVASPEKHSFSIKKNPEGDIVEGLDFSLKSTLIEAVDSTYVEASKIAMAEQVPVERPVAKPTEQPAVKTVTKPIEQPIEAPPSKAIAKPISVPASATKDQYIATETDRIYLQTGAFRSRNNAQKTANLQSSVIHYPVDIVLEDGWYKVRFGAFNTKSEVDACKKAIVDNGILKGNQIMEIHHSKTGYSKKTTTQPVVVPTTTTDPPVKTPLKEPSESPVVQPPTVPVKTPAKEEKMKTNILKKHYFVQIGAFLSPKNATDLIKNITNLVPYPVSIVYRDKFYKVRYGPFETQQEMNDCIRLIVEKNIVQKNLLKIFFEEIGFNPTSEIPSLKDGFHIEAGVFNDKSDATLFYKKMSSEFPFPIMIVEEGDQYKVQFGPYKEKADTEECCIALGGNRIALL